MKKLIATTLITAVISLTAASQTIAGPKHNKHHNQHFNSYAEVIKVKPIYRTVEISTPQQECWTEQIQHDAGYGYYGPNSASGMLVGGLLGGIIGNQIGKGDGKKLATVVGTLIGSKIGHQKVNPRHKRPAYSSEERRCKTIYNTHTEERIEAYRVVYRYQGETFKTRLSYDPGERLRVRVSVVPERAIDL